MMAPRRKRGLRRTGIKRGSKRLKRYTPLAPRTKNPDRRRRNKQAKDHQYGRSACGNYDDFIRSKPCAAPLCRSRSPIEAAHVAGRGAHPGASGVGNLLPLCRYHHRRQHVLGIETFQRRYSVRMKQTATRYANEWKQRLKENGDGAEDASTGGV